MIRPANEQLGRPRTATIRRAMRLASANAGLWAIGNGLVSTMLVFYLATDLGATGLAVSFILAAPRFAGALRIVVPALMAGWRTRKALCIFGYSASALLLCAVPVVPALEDKITGREAIAVLVAAWCLYHFAEYIGTVTLWSWLGDIMPRRIRGRLVGQRERWLLVGRVGGLAASAALSLLWRWLLPSVPRWEPLALSAAVGAAMMLVAIVPLVLMPAFNRTPSARPQAPWRTVGRALVDPVYRRLLAFYAGFSLVNGISAAAQEMYPARVLGIDYPVRQSLQGLLRAGQLSIAPWIGRLVDRWGSRPVMVVSQLVVASGLLFYLAASPAQPWLIAGAFVAWIAYAGVNVGLDNIKLKLAPRDNNAPFLAVFYTVGDLANGVATVIGGAVLDSILAAGSQGAAFYTQLFFWSWVGRTLVVALIARMKEPGAKRVGEICGE